MATHRTYTRVGKSGIFYTHNNVITTFVLVYVSFKGKDYTVQVNQTPEHRPHTLVTYGETTGSHANSEDKRGTSVRAGYTHDTIEALAMVAYYQRDDVHFDGKVRSYHHSQ